MPPLLEYVESLLTGTGHDLDLQTFKLVDQLSGRMLGVRADITPQVARIDAHLLNRKGVTRLCYAGSVLHTLPRGMNRTREPLQIGAELYGHAGIESDVEIQRLMMHALASSRGVRRRLSRHRPRGDLPQPGAARRGIEPRARSRSCSARCRRRTCRRCKALTRKLDRARRARRSRRCPSSTAARKCSRPRGQSCRTTRRSARALRDLDALSDAAARRRPHPLLRSGGAARLPLSQRRRVRGVRRRISRTRSALRRPLRRGRQGLRARAAGDRLQHGFARARRG